MILESELAQGRPVKIFCTEPRRISAISLAQRVSEELGEPANALGGPSSLVGYNIRLEAKVSSSTRLTYATTVSIATILGRSPDHHNSDTCLVRPQGNPPENARG